MTTDVVTPDTVRKVAEFAARVAQAETVLTGIRAIHTKANYSCRECQSSWPCNTVRLLGVPK